MSAVPANFLVPLAYFEFDGSASGQAGADNGPSLLIGQMLSGTGVANTPYLVSSHAQAKALFGARSQIAAMAKIYLLNDALGPLYCMGVADPSGAESTGLIAVSGTASAAGTLNFRFGGRLIQVAIPSGTTAAQAIAAIDAAVLADEEVMVTATADNEDPETVLEFVHEGTIGNSYPISINLEGSAAGEVTPAGLTVTITQLSGGSGVPSYAAAIAAMGDDLYDYICVGEFGSASYAVWKAELDGRWSPLRQVLGGLFFGLRDTLSNLVSAAATYNSEYVFPCGAEGIPQPAWELAAAYAGQASAEGRIDPARPLQTLSLVGIQAPPPGSSGRWAKTQRNTLLAAGISTAGVVAGKLRIDRVVNSKTLSSLAAPLIPAPAEAIYTLMRVGRRMRSRIETKYPRHKLANNGTRIGAQQRIVTPVTIKAELVALYGDLELEGLVEDLAGFKASLVVERNTVNPNRLDAFIAPNLMNQLSIFAALVQYQL